ncbi:hypothetical protein AB2M62_18165 [Sphingomonas sp. MMS12-HWE2-04]|uniref:hypothetical protein n=1 Tax=Sphingomonas sp. MMS12-HWE2-04 TaxID=3234199 RepID=UPI00384D6362
MRGIVFVAALALAGCGSKTEHHLKGDDGTDVKVETSKAGETAVITTTNPDGTTSRLENGGRWPDGLAGLAPAYPGATILTTATTDQNGEKSVMGSFETKDAPAKIIAFYKPLAEAAGLKGTMNMETGEMSMFAATDEKTGRSLSIQVAVEDSKATGIVSFVTKKPE